MSEYPSAYTESSTPFYAIDDRPYGYEPPEEKLRVLSARLGTDVIWLTFQSVVDAFEFHHWSDGTRLRSLVFGCHHEERTWERSEGEAEPWERDAIFDPETLAFLSSDANDELRQQHERIWMLSSPIPGQTEPCLDARETARAVAIYYRLPGWSDYWAEA